jgi:hypothetical protein
MIKAVDQGLDEVAQALHLAFEPIEPLHWSSVEPMHCTGVDGLHWSLHWYGCALRLGLGASAGVGAPARPGG